MSEEVTWRIVPSMSMRVVRFCKDARSHFVLALWGCVVVCTEREVGVPTRRT